MNSLYPEILRCRLCGKQKNNCNFKDIFEDNNGLNLENKITKLLPVVVMPQDPLPHKICIGCVRKLDLFNEFYDNSLKTEKLLMSYFPTTPQSKVDERNAIVQITESSEVQKLLKLPPTNVQVKEVEKCQEKGTQDLVISPDKDASEKLKCFIINAISSTASVYTCRKCFRTYTKESSALTHSCSSIEECAQFRDLNSKKPLPPLKIRLYYNVANKYICNLCHKILVTEKEMSKHLKKHLLFKRSKENHNRKEYKKKKKIGTRKKKIEEGNRNQNIRENSNENMLRFCSSSQNILNKTDSPKQAYDQSREGRHEIENQEPQVITSNPANNQNLNFKNSLKPSSPTKLDELMSKEVLVIDDDKDEVYECYSCVFCDKIYTSKELLMLHQQTHLSNSKTFSNFTVLEKRNLRENESLFNCKSCGNTVNNMKDHRCNYYDYIDLG